VPDESRPSSGDLLKLEPAPTQTRTGRYAYLTPDWLPIALMVGDAVIATEEARLEQAESLTADDVEQASATLVRLRDGAWAIRHDRLRAARMVDELAGRAAGCAPDAHISGDRFGGICGY